MTAFAQVLTGNPIVLIRCGPNATKYGDRFDYAVVLEVLAQTAMIRALVPKFTTRPPTFGVRHPMASLIRVDRVSIKSYGIKPSTGMSWQMALGFIEYKKPVLAKVGPADPAKLPGAPVPKTEADKLLQGLKDQIANFGKKP